MINIDIDHFRARILQDCLTEATAQYWVQRAHQFQQAAPRLDRLDEFHGNATIGELLDAHQRCMATMHACLRHADLLRQEAPEEISDEVWAPLDQVA
jgi:hypothetical protein